MLNRKIISRFTAISGLSIAGFIAGISYERYRTIDTLNQCSDPYLLYASDKLKKVSSMPGLPIFGTVSAATAFLPETIQEKSSDVVINPNRVSQIMKYGFPGLDNVRSYSDFVLSYDRRNRVAHWVFEHLTAETVKSNGNVNRSKCDFKSDESIHPFFRSHNSDYKGSGFDRGHMAAAGNHKSHQLHCAETFYLTNMAPQVGSGFNRDSWNRLEKHVRHLTKQYSNVYVCTGPLYLPRKENDGKTYVKYQVIGSNSVAVPTHFYKIIVGETANQRYDLEAYVMPNQKIDDNTPLNVFQVPPESIERAAGLLFFDKIAKKQLQKINGKKV